jgi:hypothetical protein
MKRMATRTVAALVVLAALLLTGCTSVQRPATTPEAAPGGPSTGTMVAPGLNDLADGTSEAIGTLEWVDLEARQSQFSRTQPRMTLRMSR